LNFLFNLLKRKQFLRKKEKTMSLTEKENAINLEDATNLSDSLKNPKVRQHLISMLENRLKHPFVMGDIEIRRVRLWKKAKELLEQGKVEEVIEIAKEIRGAEEELIWD
jgi:hypothetical protein